MLARVRDNQTLIQIDNNTICKMCSKRRINGGLKTTSGEGAPPDFFLSILLLGDYGSGKSSLLQTMSGRKPHAKHAETHCPMSLNVHLIRGQKVVKMRIKDSGGQEKFRSLTASYYRGAHGCLVLFDVTKETTFDNLTYWLHDLKEYSTYPEISTILVGTKCHVPPEQRQVSFERAQKYADSVGLPYMEVSAEEGKNVTEVFEKLADIIIEKITAGQTPIISPPIKLVHEKAKRKQSFCSC